jgi:aldehyde dehydrogenase (NAD+)
MAIAELERTATVAAYDGFDKQFIGGSWRAGRSGRTDTDRDPFTGEALIEIPLASGKDLDEAYRAATEAQPAWADALPMERAAVMERAAAVMEARHEEIISWLIREAGSTRLKAQLEWSAVHAVMKEAASVPYRVEGKILPGDVPGKECRVYRQPVGVVGVISPWNWPLQLSNRSVAPALAAGNAVVLKPASDTPISGGLLLGKIYEEAGMPPGVLSVVVGAGSEIGDAFVSHPVPRVISFTGSTPVGRNIARLAAEGPIMKKIELELGGNSPMVVLDDADLDHAVNAAVFGKFLHQGQICMITNRFIVQEPVYDAFVDRFASEVRGLKYGNPGDPDTMVGPVINRSQLDGLLEKVRDARASDARELVGGEPEGQVLPPHVFADVANDQPLAHEEIFGPIAPVIRARDEEDALRLANDTSFGLSSSVFTTDVQRGVRFAQRVEAGMTHVNDQPVNDLANNPFGGEKNSGIGRFGGDWAIEAFTTDHWITVQHAPRPYPRSATEVPGPWAGG